MSSLDLPSEFLKSLRIPASEKNDFIEALHAPAPVSIRVNVAKANLIAPLEEIQWCSNGYYLKSRPRFTSDPALHAGAYYPQEASSMFLSYILKTLHLVDTPLRVLDLCASPGGKSGILRSELHPDAFLVSNEVIKSRVNPLEETLVKLGIAGFMVTSANPSAFSKLPHFFDLLVIDAPCSGEGLFRKQENAIEHWSPQAVEMCAARQRRIINDVWSTLASGGTLIYSTCTYNTKENEENLKWIVDEFDATSVRVPIAHLSKIEEVEAEGIYGYRFLPHRTKGEGLFMAVLQKPDERMTKKSRGIVPRYQKAEVPLLKKKCYCALTDKNEECFVYNQKHFEEINTVASALSHSIPGIAIGKFFRTKFKPAHGLSQLLFSEHLPQRIDLNINEALRYLEKNDISKLIGETTLFTTYFEGFRLGFAKGQQNRLISKYPVLWRIRSGMPEAYCKIVG